MLWLFEQIEEIDRDTAVKMLPLITLERREKVFRLRDESA